MANGNITGVRELQQLLEETGRAPARVLTKATKDAAKIALQYAKNHCEYKGKPLTELKQALKVKVEKRKTGKKVYQIGSFNPEVWYAHLFDYGFWATGGMRLSRNLVVRAAQTAGKKWVPGNRFLRDSIDVNRAAINQFIVNELSNSLRNLR